MKTSVSSVIKNAKPSTLHPPAHHWEEETKILYILAGGQFPNSPNVKQSATQIAFKHQLQSGPPFNKNQHKYFTIHMYSTYKLSVCLSCDLIEIAVASDCQLQQVCDYSDRFQNDRPWMCCHWHI